jgi:hypothetical protein
MLPSIKNEMAITIPRVNIFFVILLCIACLAAGWIGSAFSGSSIFDIFGIRASQGSAQEVIRGNQEAIEAIDRALDLLRGTIGR